MRNKNKKVIVFDLDETLGHFVELGIFCDVLEEYNNKKLTSKEFYEIMDIFQEFLRPNILKILSYLKTKKQKGQCDKVLIYTNNQGPKEWTQKIKGFFEKKIKYNLFDQVIAAYKVNGTIIESNRTTHDKTARDLFNCANLHETTQICFLDDLYHPLMEHDNIYYINVKPYTNYIPFNEMAEKYYKYNRNKVFDKSNFIKFIGTQMNKYNFKGQVKSSADYNEDKDISKDILNHIHKFFKLNKIPKTRKNIKKKKNITLKK